MVRNPFGAGFFHLRKIGYVIGDVLQDDCPPDSLQEADVVVIAAVARGDFHTAKDRNAQIIETSLKRMRKGAVAVFFSSIRVFARSIDRNLGRFAPLLDYDREQKASEKFFTSKAKELAVRGRVFRLGHVIGFRQAKNDKFFGAIAEGGKLSVHADSRSNTVHTLTIADAIAKSAEDPRLALTATLQEMA